LKFRRRLDAAFSERGSAFLGHDLVDGWNDPTLAPCHVPIRPPVIRESRSITCARCRFHEKGQ
jgi:hypothetical protein